MDTRTLMLVNMMMNLTTEILLFIYFQRKKTFPGFGYWIIAYILTGLGYASYTLLLPLSMKVSAVVLTNGFMVASHLFRYNGFRVFFGSPKLKAPIYLIPLIIVAESFFLLKWAPPTNGYLIRTILLTLFSVLFIFLSVRTLLIALNGNKSMKSIFLPIILILCILAISLLSRIVAAIVPQVSDSLIGNLIHKYSLVLLFINYQAFGLYLFILNNFQTQMNIKKSMREMKILHGILPICSVCKKVRDDEGYWNRLEQYIQEHSEINFTKDVCPQCKSAVKGET